MKLKRNSAQMRYAAVRSSRELCVSVSLCLCVFVSLCLCVSVSFILQVLKFLHRDPVLSFPLLLESPEFNPANLSRNGLWKLGKFDPPDPFVRSEPLIQKSEDGIGSFFR